MHRYEGLVSAVWAEACREIEVEHSVARIAACVGRRLPLQRLVVLRLDASRRAVQVAAAAPAAAGDPPWRRDVDAAEWQRVLEWAGLRRVVSLTDADSPAPPCLQLLPDRRARGDRWLAGPLHGDQGPTGALLVSLSPDTPREEVHVQLVTALLEPLAAALSNDHRLRELRTLREAAEAEKQSALTRLGRDRLMDTVVGANGGLRSALSRVAAVARADVPVLLLGETGTGKEVIARVIHEQSGRANGPFIRVNSGAIPSEMIDAELFGHERGAFTGAMSARRGWFERADGGTLLLDEIGELPLPAQVRLLRVLQEGVFERVGGERAIHVDVRMIAATHRDLPVMVQHGSFREDLWYRIAGFPVVLPPLRERRQDIPELARHFAAHAARRFGLRPQMPTASDIAALTAYAWPGNIRELASVIDRAAILGDGSRLDIAAALPGHADPAGPGRRPAPLPDAAPTTSIATLDEAMRAHIEHALAACAGRIEGPAGAARLLAINPHTLRARMRKLGIRWASFRQA